MAAVGGDLWRGGGSRRKRERGSRQRPRQHAPESRDGVPGRVQTHGLPRQQQAELRICAGALAGGCGELARPSYLGLLGGLLLSRQRHQDENGEGGDYQQTARDPHAPAPRGSVSAALDVLGLELRWRLAVALGVGEPGLRLAQVTPAQQVAAVAIGQLPLVSSYREAGMRVAPVEVGLQGVHECVELPLELLALIERHPVRGPQLTGDLLGLHGAIEHRHEALVHLDGLLALACALGRARGVGADHVHEGLRGLDPLSDALPPVRRRWDVGQVDPHVLATAFQRWAERVRHERLVLARVGDEGVVATGLGYGGCARDGRFVVVALCSHSTQRRFALREITVSGTSRARRC